MKKIFLLSLVVFLSLEGSGCAFNSKRTSQNVIDDSNLTMKVKSKLANDAALTLFKIDVDTRQGVVTLTGNVPTEGRKKRAADSAASVEGVRAVENLLQVGEKKIGASFEDAVITSKITTGLIREPLTHSLSIDVETNKGNVVLSGRVKSEEERLEAERIALNTDGVVSVENQLRVVTTQ
jgi:hyperosmotically inducible protein